jgi:DNA polymerase-3 subunit alpha
MGQAEKIASAIGECHRLGIRVLPPDINRSGENFGIEQVEAGAAAIRFGLAATKNVGATAIRPIISIRDQSGPFNSIDDFCRRADLRNLNKRALESMIKAGALDSLGSRGSLLAGIDRILSLAQTEQRLKEVGQSTMFDLWGQSVEVPLPSLDLPDVEIPAKERLAWEKELLGVYLSEHPFTQASQQLAAEVDAFCGQIGEEMVGQTVITAGLVTSVRKSFTRDRRPFVSAVLEDFGGSIEVTAWAEVYQRTTDLWHEGNTLLVKGKVRTRSDRIQLTCQSVSLYQPRESEESVEQTAQLGVAPSRHRLKINLPTSDDTNADIARLRQLFYVLSQFPGKDEVYLSIVSGEGVTKLELPDLATDYCTELHQQLVDLVDEQDLIMEETVS